MRRKSLLMLPVLSFTGFASVLRLVALTAARSLGVEVSFQ